MVTGIKPAEQGGADTADMEISGGARRKTGSQCHQGSRSSAGCGRNTTSLPALTAPWVGNREVCLLGGDDIPPPTPDHPGCEQPERQQPERSRLRNPRVDI